MNIECIVLLSSIEIKSFNFFNYFVVDLKVYSFEFVLKDSMFSRTKTPVFLTFLLGTS